MEPYKYIYKLNKNTSRSNILPMSEIFKTATLSLSEKAPST